MYILLLLTLIIVVFVIAGLKQKGNSNNASGYSALTLGYMEKSEKRDEIINEICKIIDKDYNEVKSMVDFCDANNNYDDENVDKFLEPILVVSNNGIKQLKIIRDKIYAATGIKCALITDEEILHDDKFNIDYVVM